MNTQSYMQEVAKRLSKNLYIMMGSGKRWKARELAKVSGVSENTISHIKNDIEGNETPKIETIVKLSDALGVDIVDMLKK